MDVTKNNSGEHSIKIFSLTFFKTVTVTWHCTALDFTFGYEKDEILKTMQSGPFYYPIQHNTINPHKVYIFYKIMVENWNCYVSLLVFLFAALCADGQYYKYNFNSKGESYRESYCKFLQMTDDWEHNYGYGVLNPLWPP